MKVLKGMFFFVAMMFTGTVWGLCLVLTVFFPPAFIITVPIGGTLAYFWLRWFMPWFWWELSKRGVYDDIRLKEQARAVESPGRKDSAWHEIEKQDGNGTEAQDL